MENENRAIIEQIQRVQRLEAERAELHRRLDMLEDELNTARYERGLIVPNGRYLIGDELFTVKDGVFREEGRIVRLD